MRRQAISSEASAFAMQRRSSRPYPRFLALVAPEFQTAKQVIEDIGYVGSAKRLHRTLISKRP